MKSDKGLGMPRIKETGIILRNPAPQFKSEQAWMPGLVQLGDKEFLCVFKRAAAIEAVECYFARCRSTDGGKTYVDEGVLWGPEGDDKSYSYGYAYPELIADGTLLLTGYRWDRSGQDRHIYNPDTLGAVPVDTLIFRSADGGHTWSPPQVVNSPDGRMGNASGRVVPLKDGRLLLPFETWKPYDDPNPPMQSSLALFSSDSGRTWDEYAVVAHDLEGRLLHWNGMFTRLQDDRLFVMYWTKDYHTGQDLTVHATYSEDEGRTWVEPYDTGIEGQMGSSIDVGGGRVLAVYNRRDVDNPGTYAVISEDGGRTWPPLEEHLVVWDARSRDIMGSRDQEDKSIYEEGLFAFGKPDAHLLPNGEVYVGYWCTSGFVCQLHWCRLQVE
ncbi:MAG: sialidase family protein [Lentisphaeria bacterium]|nr:sialidase family protein [Lentisphaeria bacterium]